MLKTIITGLFAIAIGVLLPNIVHGYLMPLPPSTPERFGPGTFVTLLVVLGFISIVLLPLSAFWIWMVVDVARRPIGNKMLWVLIIIFLGILGAVPYFFIPRRRHKQQQREQQTAPTPL